MLIAMAVYDTEENQRTELTRQTLLSLKETVNFTRHRLIVVDNGSCDETIQLYQEMRKILPFKLTTLRTNVGTAMAINKAWREREPGEHAVKMDNDVIIHQRDWPDRMNEVFVKDATIGICGLKRKDLIERPDHPEEYWRSAIRMLPHKPGEHWLVVEEVNHVMGTCQAYSDMLLNTIGYLYQMQDYGNLYGFDDSLASLRADIAGFKRVFLPSIPIDHIDQGGTNYTNWKAGNAGRVMSLYHQVMAEYKSGERDIYYDGP